MPPTSVESSPRVMTESDEPEPSKPITLNPNRLLESDKPSGGLV